MLDSTMKSYNEIVDIIESCTADLMELDDLDINDKFMYINQRLSYFSLEVLFKFSHNH